MKTIPKTNTSQIPRIERGMTKVYVPHEEGEIAFAYPSIGPGTYANIGKQILDSGLQIPTGEQVASLFHSAYCVPQVNDEPEFQNIRDIMGNRWLWVFNRNLWTSEGVYVVHDSEAVGLSQPLNKNELEEMLLDGKENLGVIFGNGVNFARKGTYNLGEHNHDSLGRDGFMIASYGEEGAEKLAEISTKFKSKPSIYGLEISEGKGPIQRVSALYSYWIFVDRMVVVGVNWDGNVYGHSFGICVPRKKPIDFARRQN
ncbi:MAG: hypothetical protein ABIH49_02890 [archaeon]